MPNITGKIIKGFTRKIVTPIGSQKDLEVDVRVIATTNRNMMAKSPKVILEPIL